MYLSVEEIKKAFAHHLMKYRGYSEAEAEMAVYDFPDPYSNCYLNEDFIEHVEIDGISYEKNASSTSLWRVGIEDVPEFFFYTYYRDEDIPNHKVGEYKKAQKLYQVENLDKGDFPKMN